MDFKPINDPLNNNNLEKYKAKINNQHPGRILGHSNILHNSNKRINIRVKSFLEAREKRNIN